MFHQFEVFPGHGVGVFVLGESMFTTMTKLGDEIEARFMNGDGLISVIHLPQFDINLIFDAKMQRLVLIEMKLDQRGFTMVPNMLKFRGEPIKKFDFKTIYDRILGPTYPGIIDSVGDYYLSYSGITFKFESTGDIVDVSGVNAYELIQNMNTCHKEINCNSIMIVKSNKEERTWLDTLNHLKSLLQSDNPVEKSSAMTVSNINDKSINQSSPQFLGKYQNLYAKDSQILIDVCFVNVHEGVILLKFLSHPLNLDNFIISIGNTTIQDIIKNLGPPCDSLSKKVNIKGSDYKVITIHNYFKYGIDIFYHPGNLSYVEKIIIHNNCIESMEFMKYERLNIVFTTLLTLLKKMDKRVLYQFDELNDGSNFMKWESIVKTLKLNIDKQPIFLNRKGYEINEDFTNIEIDNKQEKEQERDDYFNSKNDDLDKWALSKLMVTKNAIFEILIKDNSLSNVTLLVNKRS